MPRRKCSTCPAHQRTGWRWRSCKDAMRRRRSACPGQTIVRGDQRNSGISLCCDRQRRLAIRSPIFMPDWSAQERACDAASMAADVALFRGRRRFLLPSPLQKKLGQARAPILPRHSSNPVNADEHAEGTGPDCGSQIASDGGTLAASSRASGSGGHGDWAWTLSQRAATRASPSHPVEPIEFAHLSVGTMRQHSGARACPDESSRRILNPVRTGRGEIGVNRYGDQS